MRRGCMGAIVPCARRPKPRETGEKESGCQPEFLTLLVPLCLLLVGAPWWFRAGAGQRGTMITVKSWGRAVQDKGIVTAIANVKAS